MLRRYPEQDRAVVRVKGMPDLELRLKGRELPPAARLTTLRITRDGRRCTVSLGFKTEKRSLASTGRAVGLDMRMGLARVVTSDGQYWGSRETDDRQVKRQQRKVSRSHKGSNRRRKRVQRLANTHRCRRVRNHQGVHRFTSRVVRHHDFIALEALDIPRMVSSAPVEGERGGRTGAAVRRGETGGRSPRPGGRYVSSSATRQNGPVGRSPRLTPPIRAGPAPFVERCRESRRWRRYSGAVSAGSGAPPPTTQRSTSCAQGSPCARAERRAYGPPSTRRRMWH